MAFDLIQGEEGKSGLYKVSMEVENINEEIAKLKSKAWIYQADLW